MRTGDRRLRAREGRINVRATVMVGLCYGGVLTGVCLAFLLAFHALAVVVGSTPPLFHPTEMNEERQARLQFAGPSPLTPDPAPRISEPKRDIEQAVASASISLEHFPASEPFDGEVRRIAYSRAQVTLAAREERDRSRMTETPPVARSVAVKRRGWRAPSALGMRQRSVAERADRQDWDDVVTGSVPEPRRSVGEIIHRKIAGY